MSREKFGVLSHEVLCWASTMVREVDNIFTILRL